MTDTEKEVKLTKLLQGYIEKGDDKVKTKCSSDVRCVSHSVSLLGSKIISPMLMHRKQLPPEVIDMLARLEDVITISKKIAGYVRGNSTLCHSLPRLPTLPCDTRWLNGVHCLKDVMELMDFIQKNIQLFSPKGRERVRRLGMEDEKLAHSILLVFSPLMQYNEVFQNQKKITLNLVLPAYKHLDNRFKQFLDNDFSGVDIDTIDKEYVQAMSESGRLAIKHYYAEFTDLHYGAVLLSPYTKKMSNFDATEKSRAKHFIMNQLPKDPSPMPISPAPTQTDGIDVLYALS
ncbi:hypothetical protein CRE_25997 [Caenorhabditis remanei]|uniref:Uncharacterized protein n=1 Tax=Caenorhabditis remanei TaxID=31234 RepID=E3NRB7_CAERE|nr:hypothetical protein CRE_25997 [Caenorhabditis remanei]